MTEERVHFEYGMGRPICGQREVPPSRITAKPKDATCGNCKRKIRRRNRTGDW